MGVIDTLSAGFRLVFRKPWLALIPFLLDIAPWRAPRLSMSVLIERLLSWLNDWTASLDASQITSESLTETVTLLRETVATINVFGYVAWDSLGVPSIAASMPIQDGDAIIQITQLWQLALAAAAVCCRPGVRRSHLVLIGTGIKGKALSYGELAQSVGTAWARLGVIALAIGLQSCRFPWNGNPWTFCCVPVYRTGVDAALSVLFPPGCDARRVSPLAAAIVSIHVRTASGQR